MPKTTSGGTFAIPRWMLVFLVLTGCSALEQSSVLIGRVANAVQSDFKVSKQIEFSTVDYQFNGGTMSKSIDLLDLQIKVQEGSAQNGVALIGLRKCYGPRVRDGIPIIQCHTIDDERVILTGTEEVRSELLHLEETGMSAYVVANILGEYGGSVLFLVV